MTVFRETNTVSKNSIHPNLRFGTCSWKYDSWKGIVYDPAKKYTPYDYLPDYAKHFSTVEIDEWFWSLFPTGAKLPNPNAVKIYTDNVPENFLFTVKAPNAITLTHYYAKQPPQHQATANQPNPNFLNSDLLKKFLEILQPMGNKLGPVMFQFEYLNKQKMPSLKQFLDLLSQFFAKAPGGYDYALEIRNPNYLTEPLNHFLREYNISPVLMDGYYMPPLTEAVEKIDISAGKSLIIRLQGPDREGIEKLTNNQWDKIISPQDEKLNTLAGIIQEQVKKNRKVFINVNNHYEGSAPLTIKRIEERLLL